MTGGGGVINVGQTVDSSARKPYTHEMWFLPGVYDDAYRYLFTDFSSNFAGRQSYGLYANTPDTLILERWVNGGPVVAKAALPPVGAWTHIAAIYDGQALSLVVNGIEVAAAADTRPAVAKTGSGLVIGCCDPAALRGTRDELAVYDHPLSIARIKAHLAAR